MTPAEKMYLELSNLFFGRNNQSGVKKKYLPRTVTLRKKLNGISIMPGDWRRFKGYYLKIRKSSMQPNEQQKRFILSQYKILCNISH